MYMPFAQCIYPVVSCLPLPLKTLPPRYAYGAEPPKICYTYYII